METTTGYRRAKNIEPGTTITRVYFCEPGQYTVSADGAEYATYEDALIGAIARHRAAEKKHRAAYAETPDDRYLPLPEKFSIDCRWVMRKPEEAAVGGSLDEVISRTTYQTLAEGVDHLNRLGVLTQELLDCFEMTLQTEAVRR